MLVYANRLRVQGSEAESAVFKAIGGWLKEQLGFGLRPDQLKQDGEYNGNRGELRSRLRIHGCFDGEPALCAWVLKHADDDVQGRQWIVEVGVKKSAGTLEVSCVVKSDERSTLVSSPVSASQPRVIQYIANNVLSAKDADFVDAVPGEILRTVGQDLDSYRAFLAEIEQRDRDGAIVLVSATREGEYLVNPTKLQRTLVGLAHVVQVLPGSNSYEMAEILGQPWSAWEGAVNVLSIPSSSGKVRSRYFLRDEILAWGRGASAHFDGSGLGYREHQYSAPADACAARGRHAAFHAAAPGESARDQRTDERGAATSGAGRGLEAGCRSVAPLQRILR